MVGAGWAALLLLSSASPELPARAVSSQEASPMSGAVSIAASWGLVTSVHRSPERNRAVGGAPNSFHLRGRAIDVARRAGVRHAQIDAAFRQAGYHPVESLDEGDHSHFAFGTAVSVAPAEATRPVRYALNAPVIAACSAERKQAPLERRRPDRENACASTSATTAGLRPIAPADD